MFAMKKVFLILCLIFFFVIENKAMTLPDGISIPLTLTHDVSSKTAKKGDVVIFKVTTDVYENDELIIPEGAIAYGTVIKAKKRGVWGRAGSLIINVDKLELNNGEVMPLIADEIMYKGKSKKRTANTWFWCGIIYVPLNVIPPLFIKGENAIIEAGYSVVATTK